MTEETLLDRVTSALSQFHENDRHDLWRRAARVAIQALRMPPDEIQYAGAKILTVHNHPTDGDCILARCVFNAMIDEAMIRDS
jgi:hypothetical protein